jgi:tRNA1Val (adenine37-N6)-methyltransferase
MARHPPPETDRPFAGALRLAQPPRGAGYRANVDALLLGRAALLERPSARHGLDLGAGVGTVGLTYALFSGRPVTLVERDAAAAALARLNAGPFADARVIEADVADVAVRADLIVCNPPYTEPSAGRRSPDPGRDAARRGRLAPFLSAAARCLDGPDARALFIYPSEKLPELWSTARAAALSPASVRFVHPRREAPARAIIVSFVARPAGQTLVHPPWFEWHGARRDPDLAAFLAGTGEPPLPPPARGR